MATTTWSDLKVLKILRDSGKQLTVRQIHGLLHPDKNFSHGSHVYRSVSRLFNAGYLLRGMTKDPIPSQLFAYIPGAIQAYIEKEI